MTANSAILPAGTNGDVSVFASNNTDLVIDLNGYFAPPGAGALYFNIVSPCRVLDTRSTGSHQPFSGTLSIQVVNTCNVPLNASAVLLNATAVPSAPLGYLTLFPYGSSQPLTSNLNSSDGAIVSNMVIVPTLSGAITAFATNPTHLILDITGYFAP